MTNNKPPKVKRTESLWKEFIKWIKGLIKR